MVEAFGGIYQGYNDLQLNPLDVGEDTPDNRNRIYSILKSMAPETAAFETTDEELAHISAVISKAAASSAGNGFAIFIEIGSQELWSL